MHFLLTFQIIPPFFWNEYKMEFVRNFKLPSPFSIMKIYWKLTKLLQSFENIPSGGPMATKKNDFFRNHYIIKKVNLFLNFYHILCNILNYPPHFSEWKYIENWTNYRCCPKIHPQVGSLPWKKMIFLRNHYIKQKVSLFLNFYHILCVISNYPPLILEWKYIEN